MQVVVCWPSAERNVCKRSAVAAREALGTLLFSGSQGKAGRCWGARAADLRHKQGSTLVSRSPRFSVEDRKSTHHVATQARCRPPVAST